MKKIKILDNNTPAFITRYTEYFVEEATIPQVKEKNDVKSETDAVVLAEKRFLHPKLQRDGYNGYDCKTPFCLQHVIVDYIWVQSGEEFYRTYKIATCDLSFYKEYSEEWSDKIVIWGNKVIEVEENHCKSLVYQIDQRLEGAEVLLKDAEEFAGNGSFAEFLEDVLGDAG